MLNGWSILITSLKGDWFPHNNTDFLFLIVLRFISRLISLNIVFLIVLLLIVFLPVQLIFFNCWMVIVFLYCRSLYCRKQVDHLTHFGNVTLNKENFLPLLVKVRTKTYTKENILGAWRGSPSNPRTVLTKLQAYQDPEKQANLHHPRQYHLHLQLSFRSPKSKTS